MLKLTNHMSH